MQKTALLVLSRQFFKQSKSRILLSGIWMAFLLLPLTAFSQDLGTVKINLDIHNVPLKEAFAEMQKLSSIKFVYGEDVNTYASARVSITDENISLKDALTRTLNGTNLRYTQKGDHVMIDEKPGAQHSTPQPKGQGGSGSLKGRVVEAETSEPLPGASVVLVGGKLATSTNVDGYYQFDRVPSGEYMIEVSYMGFKKEQIKVQVSASKTATYDVKLAGDATALDEITVSAVRKQRSSVPHMTEKMMVQEIKALQVVASGISSEQISRTADRNAADVVKKIAGVTIKDDKFVVIRGMNERYNLTYLNGNVAPSTELYSRAFALNLLPTRIIDRILVQKSISPENMADATGGVVKLYTKDAQTVKHFDVEVQLGYLDGTTFNNNFLSYKGGKYDFLGFDDGMRKLPSSVPGYGDFRKANISQKEYANSFSNVLTSGKKTVLPTIQFTMNYYDAWNVFGKTLSSLTSLSYKNEPKHYDNTRLTDNYTWWDSVEKGEYTPTSVKYTEENTNTEDSQLSLLQNFTFKLNDNNKIYFKNFILQQGQSGTIVKNSKSDVYFRDGNWQALNDFLPANFRKRDIILSYSQRFLYSGNIGGNWTITENKKHLLDYNLGLTYSKLDMPDQRIIHLKNGVLNYEQGMPSDVWITDYEQNWTGAWRGQDWEHPDNTAELGMISRTWIRNNEKVYSGSLDYTFQALDWLKLKAGTYNQFKEREVFRRAYTVNEGDLPESGNNDYSGIGSGSSFLDQKMVYFRQQDLGQVWSENYLRDNGSALKVVDRTGASDAYTATEQNNSGYMLADLSPFGGKLEIHAGARIEYNRQKIAGATPAPGVGTFITPGEPNIPIFVNLEKTEILPAINLGYRPTAAWVFRAAYGKTVNRPEVRELAPYSELDYLNNQTVTGNPDLISSSINNYDVRLEWYFPDANLAEMFSLGAFYKDIQNPIERIIRKDMYYNQAAQISYNNADKAKIYGLEVEARKSLNFIPVDIFRNFYIIANGALFHSNVKRIVAEAGNYEAKFNIDRQLQGQSPYTYNAGLYYENAGSGSKLALIYNETGPRIYAASLGKRATSNYDNHPLQPEPGDQASIIELTRRQLDFSYTQRIGKGMQLKFTVQNLLDSPIQMAEDANFTYKYEKAKQVVNSNPQGLYNPNGFTGDLLSTDYKPGRYFSLNFSYSF